MVCTSLGSLLRPLFYFLCYIHFSLSVVRSSYYVPLFPWRQKSMRYSMHVNFSISIWPRGRKEAIKAVKMQYPKEMVVRTLAKFHYGKQETCEGMHLILWWTLMIFAHAVLRGTYTSLFFNDLPDPSSETFFYLMLVIGTTALLISAYPIYKHDPAMVASRSHGFTT